MLATIGIVALILLLGLVVFCYERELRSMARLLRRCDSQHEERLSVEFRTPGIVAIAHAANEKLDAQRDERASDASAQLAFQEDLAALSHDVRTPLAGAQGYLQLYDREENQLEKDRCVDEAQGRLLAMRELVDQLFEYTKAADPHREFALEQAGVFEVLADALAALYPHFAERGWSPVVDFEDETMKALVDAPALTRVFTNLITNTLRHGAAAPVITQRGRTLVFSNDLIDANSLDMARLFDRFYCADAARRVRGGGLGLAIVQHLCENLGIVVQAQKEGQTLRISLEFPQAGGGLHEFPA